MTRPETNATKLGIAFLGCGAATRMHSRTLRGSDGVDRFYVSRDPRRADAYRERFGGAGAFPDLDAALSDPRVDAVFVATPPALHLEPTLAAVGAGKHVIVEKPAFLDTAALDRAGAAAARAGVRVLVAENYFYKPLLGRLRELLAEGAIGDVRVLYVNAMKSQTTGDWRDEPELAGGGALFEGGIHWVSFMNGLGLDVAAVHAWRPGAGGERSASGERSAVVVFHYEGGAVGTLYFSWDQPSPLRGLRISRIYGSRGTIAFESNGVALSVWGRRRRISFPGFRDISGYRAMFADFVDVLRSGRAPRMTLERARRDLELVEEAYRSFS